MGSLITNRGKAAQPAFYAQTPAPAATKSESNIPMILFGLVVVGVVYVMVMRSSASSHSGTLVTVVPTYDADESRVINATNSALAIASLRSHSATSDT